ncbi:MAG: type II toxin-antitoxin system VapC family toxin [Burkholderiales bacterium]|nr:type II toxin-antitoxin system VapC family toxin [Burkholderiales bacterium]
MIAFFDASALIYLVEGKPPFGRRVRRALVPLTEAHPDLGTAVSRLKWLECRVGPLKASDTHALAAFDAFFARPDLVWLEPTKDVIELATAIRVKHGLRTPDALQAASGLQLGADHVFLTGDVALKRVVGLNVMLLA